MAPERQPPGARPLPLLSNPVDALPAAINHLLAAEPWARDKLAAHAGKTLDVVVAPFTVRLCVSPDGHVARGSDGATPATTVTLTWGTVVQAMASGRAPTQDLRVDGDADFAQTVSLLAQHLRWDAEEDLSKLVGDIAARRLVQGARLAHAEVARTGRRFASGVAEYLLEENPQLVYPRDVQAFADGVRTLRDDLARLEKRIDRLDR